MPTTIRSIRGQIVQVFGDVFREFKQLEPPPFHDNTPLLEVGLDSLDFAVVVTRLHDELGYDPFTLSTSAFYPTTFKEFVDFYEGLAPN